MIEKIRDMIAFAMPVRIIDRPESLVIRDYRPTWLLLFGLTGVIMLGIALILFLLGVKFSLDSAGMWALLLLATAFVVFGLKGTLREVYYFDRKSDSYRFERQFLYKKDVIQGSLGQFRAVRVHLEVGQDENSSPLYKVSLLQDGMTRGGSSEQPLRGTPAIMNSHSAETRIGNAIATFLAIPLHDTSD
ncbi:MAG: hypothetical protein ABL984_00770 [Pyrinomonadaceae bacterium]